MCLNHGLWASDTSSAGPRDSERDTLIVGESRSAVGKRSTVDVDLKRVSVARGRVSVSAGCSVENKVWANSGHRGRECGGGEDATRKEPRELEKEDN